MQYIGLTQNQKVVIDNEDYEFIAQNKWCVNKIRNIHYAIRTVTIRSQNKKENIKNKLKNIYMHRLIIEIKLKRKLKFDEEIHHINGNGLDNRKENLRIVTRSQHQALSKKRKDCTSQYKGVHWHKRDKIWIAQIRYQKKLIHLGCFENEIKAAKAYDQAALEYFGEYARINLNERGLDD